MALKQKYLSSVQWQSFPHVAAILSIGMETMQLSAYQKP